jgi:hypothetical protein
MPVNFKQNKRLTLLLVGVVAALILLVGALAFNLLVSNQNQETQASILDNQEFLSQTEEYVNEEDGYSVRYYSDWYVNDTGETVGFFRDLTGIEDSYVENLTVSNLTSYSASEYVESQGFGDSLSAIQIREMEVLTGSTTTPFGSIELQSQHYVFSQEDRIVVLKYTGEIGGDYDQFLAPAEKMVESFSFTK